MTKTKDELDADACFRGYFPASEAPQWDGVTWRRNFHEIWLRDAAAFCLGEIAGKDILGVACGSGLYMVVLTKLGVRVSGQDISPNAVAEAEKTLARHSLLERMFLSMEVEREPSRERIPEWFRQSLPDLPLLWRVFNEQIMFWPGSRSFTACFRE